MEKTASSPPPGAGSSGKGTWYMLQIVLGVAFLLATLFTAWTPADPGSRNSEEYLGFTLPSPMPETQRTATPRPRPVVGIVAGHWGNDSGAVCADGLTEVKLNLEIAVLVQKDMVSKGYEVEVLQEFDPKLTGYRAEALVSIHADSCDYVNNQASGFKVASALGTTRPERAARLTACLRSRYSQATHLNLHSTSVTNDMTNYHAFDEIDLDTPAVIIETGFMNLDRQLLETQPEVVASGIADGLLCYLNNESITAPPPTSTP